MKATTTLVSDARPCEYDRSRTYGWNGENRLISAENGDTRLEFSYDYMGRRFEKKVYTANVLTKHEKFVYDGYKLIQVLDALNSDAVTMAFAWHPESTGLDTPFSMTYDGETYYYVTDGNKNVMSLIDAAGTKVAEYVYDPFGRLLSSTGSLAEINPFRFSSEYHDDETGLVYYNYRYYSPELGRWISRDPIEEEGGVNLYAMVGNNPIMYNDLLGLYSSYTKPDGGDRITVEKCEIVIYDGHGDDKRLHEFIFPQEEDRKKITSAAAFTGCYSQQNNSNIPEDHRIPFAPMNSGTILKGSAEKIQQRRDLHKGTMKLLKSFCATKCCELIKVSIASNKGGFWEGDMTREYEYDCATKKFKKIRGGKLYGKETWDTLFK